MMKAKTIIKDLAESGIEVDEIFTKANEKLCENNEADMFVTAFIGILDLNTGIMNIANAGHNPPIIRHSNGKFEYLQVRPGLVLAAMEGIKYKKYEIKFMPGDQIYLYTDGITEAIDIKEEFYGESRLLDVINSVEISSARDICNIVKKDIDDFVGEAPQFDDITMISVKLNYVESDNFISIIPNKDSIKIVGEFAEKLSEKLELFPKIANKINIVVDEVYSNIVNYSSAKYAEVSYEVIDDKLYLIFSDDGVYYNPLETKDPDITLNVEEREIGGLGIFMVKKLAESVEYNREEDKNLLKIRFSIK